MTDPQQPAGSVVTADPPPATSSSTRAATSPAQPTVSSRLARLRSAFGVPKSELDEVNALGQHILLRVQNLPARDSNETQGMKQQRLSDWVLENFTRSLRTLLLQSSRNGRGNIILSIVIIAGGFATSGIAVAAGTGHKGTSTSWIVFSVGLAVALAGGISQLFRPGYRATQRLTLARDLKEQGWAFVNANTADYKGDLQSAFDLFDQRVTAINRRSVELIGLEPESGTGRRGTRGSGNR